MTLHQNVSGDTEAKDANGTTVFHADPPLVWDSATAKPAPTGPQFRSAAAADRAEAATPPGGPGNDPHPSDIRGPGGNAHHTRMNMTLDNGDLAITPDRGLLTDPATVYPIYIDPAWSGNPSVQAWASISSGYAKDTSGNEARLGYDTYWPGYDCGTNCNTVFRSYFQMDSSGFQGAKVTEAHFYPYMSWAADGSAEPTQVWVDSDIYFGGLDWGNKPSGGSSTLVTTNTNCLGHYTSSCGQGLDDYNVTSMAQGAANGGWRTFEVDAQDEGNKYEWKKIDPTQTKWSVTYYLAPRLDGGDTTTPLVTNFGGAFDNSNSVTMKATGSDPDGESVQSGYEIWNWANGTSTSEVVGALFSAYTSVGGAYTYSGLADGTYAWRGVVHSQQGGMWSGWSPWHVFTVDTKAPNPPTVQSPQFPKNAFGGSLSDVGSFTVTNDQSNNVAGYLVSMDGDLGSTVWSAQGQQPTWTGTGTPKAGQTYWLTADNGNGTGSMSVNGFAKAQFTPGTTGPHRLYAKAVDQSGFTSAESTYLFYAGTTTPSYVYGDQLVNGYTATNNDRTTTSVPKAVATVSAGGVIAVQNDCCDIHFADGAQALFTDNGSTGHTALNDKVVFSFDVPKAGYWDLGGNFTQSAGFGQLSVSLDNGASTLVPADNPVDGYSPYVTTTYRDFGIPKDGQGNPVSLTQGVHTLTVTMVNKNASTVGYGYKFGLDVLRLAPAPPNCAINNMTACLNNTAISSDNNTAAAGGGADGTGQTLSATDLANAGWTPGAKITVNGAPMTLPSYADGKFDNIVADGQTVDMTSLTSNSGNALVLLGFGTYGNINNASGTITYSAPCQNLAGQNPNVQSYSIDEMPDWSPGIGTAVAINFPHWNRLNAGPAGHSSRVYAISVPLACPGQAVASVTLPVVSNGVTAANPAMHVLSLGLRSSSFVAGTSQNWTGTWAAQQDTTWGSWTNQTFRVPAQISLGNARGTSGQVRIHLSNALGASPVTFPHVSVAPQAAANTAAASGTPTSVTFKGSASVTIPAGGEVFSDPVDLTVADQSTLLVSYQLGGTVNNIPVHDKYGATVWATTANSGDHTGDTAAANFTVPIVGVPYLAGIDVTYGTAPVTGSLVLYGDQTINADTATQNNGYRLADTLTSALAAANGNSVPYGVLNEGSNGQGTGNTLLPQVSNAANPTSATNPADRNILDNANVRTVLISSGTSDILAGASAATVNQRLVALVQQVRKYYADTGLTNPIGVQTVYVATIPPDPRIAANSSFEAVREAVNASILGSPGSYLNGNADGAVDFAGAVAAPGAPTTVNSAYLTSSNPNNAYYQALAQQYITATASSGGTVTVQPNIAPHTAPTLQH
ncbi:hypothetical protein ACFYNO_03195 [Kitasatospora sp. NPDC006697]|uniref:hypothetical protein n=1 Tax=Kitasatospora sp. NPDC006697 TaxID=3364020 RepID=UPI003676B47E